jgi:hypothetical protein
MYSLLENSLVPASLRATLLPVIGGLLATALMAGALASKAAQAQTPATTVKDGAGNVVLQSFLEGQLYAPGPNSGAIPATGSGTRLVWWPNNNRSVGLGYNTKATGDGSIAIGSEASAVENKAQAIGDRVEASGFAATAMGLSSVASGGNATALGRENTASGYQSFAAGAFSEAENDNTFVWSDESGAKDGVGSGSDQFSSSTSDPSSGVTGNSTFHVKATGGARFITSDNNSSVTYISGGTAGWNNTSTRSAKTNIEAVSPETVLSKLRQIEVYTWEYEGNDEKGETPRQIGPMAEEFHQAFDLGSSEKAINSINADGVSFGAILGLDRKVEEQRSTIDSLKKKVRQIESMKKRLAALEAERSRSVVAGLSSPGAGLLVAFLLGGLFGAGLLWRRGQ